MLTVFFMGMLRVVLVSAVTYTGKKLIDGFDDSDRNNNG